MERIGLEQIKAVVIDDLESRKALMTRVEFALQQVEEPWSKILNDNNSRDKMFHSVELKG
ncbi:hypothetical protein D3C77_598310 [compost metagenome]